MLALMVRFELPTDTAAAEFDGLTAAVLPLIRTREPGTLLYEPHTVEGSPLSRVFYEVYRDPAALEEHESRPHTAQFLAGIRALVTGTTVDRLIPQHPASPAG